ncbi:O(6)-methylguanine-induced apoptosis 2 isoform X2 [Rissa tridactyla]|uniref:O(6)-methylguanine-induced apoptosis 2 isoform X2 n=1 Tax=Rissa tridactyla TaxID=75485 RepID=UPI0023BB12D8|nr:O(6)-methylguanine-induced apoptosis 2 isoform X2 [Rissa tridactyla]
MKPINSHYNISDSLIAVSPKGITSCFKSKTSHLTWMDRFTPEPATCQPHKPTKGAKKTPFRKKNEAQKLGELTCKGLRTPEDTQHFQKVLIHPERPGSAPPSAATAGSGSQRCEQQNPDTSTGFLRRDICQTLQSTR